MLDAGEVFGFEDGEELGVGFDGMVKGEKLLFALGKGVEEGFLVDIGDGLCFDLHWSREDER